jgi:hypothetical protein
MSQAPGAVTFQSSVITSASSLLTERLNKMGRDLRPADSRDAKQQSKPFPLLQTPFQFAIVWSRRDARRQDVAQHSRSYSFRTPIPDQYY